MNPHEWQYYHHHQQHDSPATDSTSPHFAALLPPGSGPFQHTNTNTNTKLEHASSSSSPSNVDPTTPAHASVGHWASASVDSGGTRVFVTMQPRAVEARATRPKLAPIAMPPPRHHRHRAAAAASAAASSPLSPPGGDNHVAAIATAATAAAATGKQAKRGTRHSTRRRRMTVKRAAGDGDDDDSDSDDEQSAILTHTRHRSSSTTAPPSAPPRPPPPPPPPAPSPPSLPLPSRSGRSIRRPRPRNEPLPQCIGGSLQRKQAAGGRRRRGGGGGGAGPRNSSNTIVVRCKNAAHKSLQRELIVMWATEELRDSSRQVCQNCYMRLRRHFLLGPHTYAMHAKCWDGGHPQPKLACMALLTHLSRMGARIVGESRRTAPSVSLSLSLSHTWPRLYRLLLGGATVHSTCGCC